MRQVDPDVGGERYSVADETRQSTIVADARMAWMWKVSDVSGSNSTKVKINGREQSVVAVGFRRVRIVADAKWNSNDGCGASRR